MDNFIKVLQIIYYLIFIPLGVLLIAVIIYLVISNPLSQLSRGGGPPAGAGFGGPGGGGSPAFPSEEMMKQFMQQGQGSAPDGAGQGVPRGR